MELPKAKLFSRKDETGTDDADLAHGDLPGLEIIEPPKPATSEAVRRRLLLWGALWAVLGIGSFMPLVYFVVTEVALKAQLHASADLQLGSQRLAQHARAASTGSGPVFGQLKQIDTLFSSTLAALHNGSEQIEPAPAAIQPVLGAVDGQYQGLKKHIAALLGAEKALTELDRSSKAVNAREAEMRELAGEILAQLAQGGSARELFHAGQLLANATLIPQGARHLLTRSDPENWARDLEAGHKAYQEGLRALAAGAARDKVEKLGAIHAEITPAIEALLAGVKTAVASKQAAAPIVAAGEKGLVEATQKLTEAFSQETSSGVWEGVATFWLAVLTAFAALMFARVLVSDARRRAQESEEVNQRNQAAILRLLDEMGGLADGDLRMTATVTEDMTGAIADSINFTIGELRGLVTRINTTTEEVSSAARRAQTTSTTLLQGALKQSLEIKETSASVVAMAKSISQVSESAEESAKVAARSLAAAEKGQRAVSDSITGMNDIRQQIQETAKRIKRLGETSQEINEIVDLITDLTEQTNVLALNAAIQAAAAGDAGRGFSVVAEEVQRLAERSAQATKQIGSIVNSIQTDTQNAVAAMEQSTHGVVEGAKLSDAAGQALAEIGQVSRDLAELIATISRATREQSTSADKVVKNMKDILSITEQTTLGTRQTAESIGQLAELATQLRGSVANFKV